MKKHELANQLRQRLLERKLVEPEILDRVSDHDVVVSYIKSSCCDELQVPLSMLPAIIGQAKSATHFFDLCDNYTLLPVSKS